MILFILFVEVTNFTIASKCSVPFQLILAIISWFVYDNFSRLISDKVFEHFKSIYEQQQNVTRKTYQDKQILSIQLDQLMEKEKRLDQKYQQATQTKQENQIIETKQIQSVNHTYEQSNPKIHLRK